MTEMRHTWATSDRFVPRVFVRPAQRILAWEITGGVTMLVAALVALLWANSRWADSYLRIWSARAQVTVAGHMLWEGTTRSLVNDVAMTAFFFVVTTSICQQMVAGELRDRRKAALPVLAALGGMLVPASIYLAVAGAPPTRSGWGVPVATDVALAVGALTLLGSRIPIGAKIFMLTLAVADDVGGIAVIALFYPSHVDLPGLAAAFALTLIAVLLRRIGVRAIPPYAVLGVALWMAMDRSGVEPTIAGVILGALVPVYPWHDPRQVPEAGRPLLEQVSRHGAVGEEPMSLELYERVGADVRELRRLLRESTSPAERVLSSTGPWVSYLVLPLFALANVGVPLKLGALPRHDLAVALGVGLGLVLGKPIGITLTCLLATRFGIGRLPDDTSWTVLVGVAMLAGIGFTVALYVAAIAFDKGTLRDAARLGIVLGSATAAALGSAWVLVSVRPSLVDRTKRR